MATKASKEVQKFQRIKRWTFDSLGSRASVLDVYE